MVDVTSYDKKKHKNKLTNSPYQKLSLYWSYSLGSESYHFYFCKILNKNHDAKLQLFDKRKFMLVKIWLMLKNACFFILGNFFLYTSSNNTVLSKLLFKLFGGTSWTPFRIREKLLTLSFLVHKYAHIHLELYLLRLVATSLLSFWGWRSSLFSSRTHLIVVYLDLTPFLKWKWLDITINRVKRQPTGWK